MKAVKKPFLLAMLAVTLWRLLVNAMVGDNILPDEAQYWDWSRHLAWGYFSKPPLIGWSLGLMTHLCGDGVFCLRLPSPLLQAGAAAFLGLAAHWLHDKSARNQSPPVHRPSIGGATALLYLTMPGIFFSSFYITTDSLLLCCWCAAFACYIYALHQHNTRTPWLLWGLSAGLGLLAKYAFAYFLGGMVLHAIISPQARQLYKKPYWLLGMAIMLAITAPHWWWNATHGFQTLQHTAANASWDGQEKIARFSQHFYNLAEFLLGQLFIAGPLLWGAVGFTIKKTPLFKPSPIQEKFLLCLCFALPALLLMCLQAFMVRAHANWAATAYPAVVLLASVITPPKWQQWTWRSNIAIGLVICCMYVAGEYKTLKPDPFIKQRGWPALAAATTQAVGEQAQPVTLVTNERKITALMLYHLRHEPINVRILTHDGAAHNHFEQTLAFDPDDHKNQQIFVLAEDLPAILAEKFPLMQQHFTLQNRGKPHEWQLYELSR